MLFDNDIELFHKLYLFLFKRKLRSKLVYYIDDIIICKNIDENCDIDKFTQNDLTSEKWKINDKYKSICGTKIIHTSRKKKFIDRIKNYFIGLLYRLPATDLKNEWEFIDLDNYTDEDNPLAIENNNKIFKEKFKYLFGNMLNNLQFYSDVADDLGNLPIKDLCNFIATKGIGAHLLEYDKETNIYKIDLCFMNKYEVRNKFVPYGASLIFNNKLDPIMFTMPFTPIFDSNKKIINIINEKSIYKMNDRLLLFAYNVFISTLICYVTIIDHIMNCHLIIAGNIASAFYANKKMMHKDIYDLIYPFLFKTIDVNEDINNIFLRKGGLIYRIFGFTENGLNKFIKDNIEKYNYETIYERVKHNKIPNLSLVPLLIDAMKFMKTVNSFVMQYVDKILMNSNKNMGITLFLSDIKQSVNGLVVDKFTSKENLVRIISALIFNATFWHEHIGNMSFYTLNPRIIKTKVYKSLPDIHNDTVQNSIQGMMLTLFSSIITMPKVVDDLYKLCDEKYKDIWIQNFQVVLKRDFFICNHIAPYLLECSISL